MFSVGMFRAVRACPETLLIGKANKQNEGEARAMFRSRSRASDAFVSRALHDDEVSTAP
jgi:hypothetical protein